MLSFPRDLIVDGRCPDGRTYVGRINAAYSFCGPAGTLETVRSLTNLPIHYLITVNFQGFRDIVDKLGGVWMDVDHRYYNPTGGDATRRSTSGPATRSSRAGRRSTSSASGTRTRISSAWPASSCS